MKYILFGAGGRGINALYFLGSENVYCFCDNVQAGNVIEGKKVVSFDELKKIHQSYTVIITTSNGKYMVEIALKLRQSEISFVLFEDEADKYIEKDFQQYEALNKRVNFRPNKKYSYPICWDKGDQAGNIGSYFYQDLWAAKKIFVAQPEEHYDIGSRVDGFIAHLLSFRKNIKLLDIRPLESKISGVDFIQCDATNLDNIPDNSIESLSALCSLEHFGLGRYGDPIDPEACFKCFAAIQKKIKKNGKIYISLPVGKEHIEFNAHRVFYAETIVRAFDGMVLEEYSTTFGENIDYNVDVHAHDEVTAKGGNLFGLFVFKK